MRICGVQNHISFQRALTPSELKEQAQLQRQASQLLGQTGNSVFIIQEASLPQSAQTNTGVSSLASDESLKFFKEMKDYLGFNMVEVFPPGQRSRSSSNTYIPYGGTALSLGNHQISPELLTKDTFNNILTTDEFKEIVAKNTWEHKNSLVNYENVIEEDSAQEQALKKAFKRFMALDENSDLKKNYTTFLSENDDWLEPRGVFKAAKKENDNKWLLEWANEFDQNLYDPKQDRTKSQIRINELKEKYSTEIDFYKFKQFLTEEHLQIGRKNLHGLDLKLIGDCHIGFEEDDLFANPTAFKKGVSVGWELPALDYETIKDPNSEAAKVLMKKVELFAKRYDGIRFDVGWAYVAPKLNGETHEVGDDSILKMIENTVKRVQGKNFDQNNLLYEFEAGPEDFSPFKNGKLRPELQNRINVNSQAYIADDWGYLEEFVRRGWVNEDLLLGVANHDPICLRQLAEGKDPLTKVPAKEILAQREPQVKLLAKLLKLDENTLRTNPAEFAKAKFALPLNGKHVMAFFVDVFGDSRRFDKQDFHDYQCYRNKVPENYIGTYINSLKEGFGYNRMDALAKRFRSLGFDEKHPELLKQLIKFRDILLEPDTVSGNPPKVSNEVEAEIDAGLSAVKKPQNRYLKAVLLSFGALAAAGTLTLYAIKKSKAKPDNEQSEIQSLKEPLPPESLKSAPVLKNKFIIA